MAWRLLRLILVALKLVIFVIRHIGPDMWTRRVRLLNALLVEVAQRFYARLVTHFLK